MATPDVHLPDDARLYAHRQYQTVFALPAWPELAAWKRQRQAIRRHLLLCAGLSAQTAAFRAKGRVVRRFVHEGVTIENLCIETLPGLYVIGNLYRPAAARGRKLPLVLHPHGHAMHARTVPLDLYSVPHRAMNTALLGMAAFAYSMIGYDHDAMQLEHRGLLRGPDKEVCNALGLSLFGLQLNNSIKALDYLLARGDIDARKVGCTGESGGGTQTYFLAAADDRVRVAAPAVMLSGHFQGGCECENAPSLHLRWSNLYYAGLIAPRPLLLTGCTGDWSHHLRERELPCLRQLYERYGKAEAIAGFYQDEAHNYNRASREAVYAWMVRWLLDPKERRNRIPEADVPVPATEDLLVFDTPAPPYKGAVRSRRRLIDTWKSLHTRPAGAAETADVLDLDLPARDDLLVRSQTPRHAWKRRDALHTITYGRFSQDSLIRCRFAAPKRGQRSYLVLRAWNDEGAWQRFCARPPAQVRRLIDEGCGILVPILFGQGNLPEAVAAFRAQADAADLATTYNRTPALHRAADILTTVRLAQAEMGIAPASLAAVADGDMGLLAYAAWAAVSAQVAAGPLAADLAGADLEGPAIWAKRAYVPLLAGAGGAAALAVLWGKARATFTGARAGTGRGLLPKGSRRQVERAGLGELLAMAQRL